MSLLKTVEVIRQRVIDGESESVLLDLLKIIEQEKKLNIHKHTVELLIGDLKEIKRWENSGQLTFEESRVYKNQINGRTLSLIDDLLDNKKLSKKRRSQYILKLSVLLVLVIIGGYFFYLNSVWSKLSISLSQINSENTSQINKKESVNESSISQLERQKADQNIASDKTKIEGEKIEIQSLPVGRAEGAGIVSADLTSIGDLNYPTTSLLIQNHSDKQIAIIGFDLVAEEVVINTEPILVFCFTPIRSFNRDKGLSLEVLNIGWGEAANLKGEIYDQDLASIFGKTSIYFRSSLVSDKQQSLVEITKDNIKNWPVKLKDWEYINVRGSYYNKEGVENWFEQQVDFLKIDILSIGEEVFSLGTFRSGSTEFTSPEYRSNKSTILGKGIIRTELPNDLNPGIKKYDHQDVVPPISTVKLRFQVFAQKSCFAKVKINVHTTSGTISSNLIRINIYSPKNILPYHKDGEFIPERNYQNNTISNSLNKIVSLLHNGGNQNYDKAIEICIELYRKTNYQNKYREAWEEIVELKRIAQLTDSISLDEVGRFDEKIKTIDRRIRQIELILLRTE